MAKDVLITPLDGIIQFSSSAGSGSGQIKVDGDDLVVSNLIGDVLLGDGASDIFIGDGTNNVDIVFEQNGEIRDDGTGKNIIFGSKTTNVFVSGSNTVALQSGGGNVGIGKSTATKELEVAGDISASGDLHINGNLLTSGSLKFPTPSESNTNNGIVFFDTSSNAPNTKVNAIKWDFSNDDAFIYAHQSSSDGTYLVNELSDNTSTDKFVWWFNNFAGANTDSFPLMMEGNKFVVNYIKDRRVTFHRDNGAVGGNSNNVDFFLLKSGSSSVSTANSLIHGDVSTGKTTLNDIIFIDGNLTASGNISASGTITSNGINSSGAVLPVTSNGAALGSTSKQWSDLFLASGGVINFNNGDATITGDGSNLDLVHNQGSFEGGMRLTTFGDIIFANVTDGDLNFGTDVKLFISQSTGNVGIGDNIFNPPEKLTVAGNISASGVLKADTGISSSGDIKLVGGANDIIFGEPGDTTSQNYGIKTDGNLFLDIDKDNDNTGNFFQFRSNQASTNIMRMKDTGEVGIGNTSPTEKLVVEGNISASGDASIGTAVNQSAVNAYGTLQVNQNADNDESGIGIQNRLNGRSLRIYVDSSNNSVLNSGDGGGQPLILNEGAGKVGIGTTTLPSVLTVDGDMKATHITASGNISGSATSTGSFGKGFFDGRVGINDNTPSFQLDVNGTFRSTGYARADGGVYANDFFHAIGGDGFTFDSHITASGNISSSGQISATNYLSNGMKLFERSTTTGVIVAGNGGDASVNMNNITASGDISSSGTIQGASLTIDDITIDGSTISDSGTMTMTMGLLSVDSAGDIILDAGGETITFKDSGASRMTFNLDTTPEIDVAGDFTIDGSGDIKLDSATKVIDLVGNVTASGNISSSGGFFVSSSGNVMINSDNTGSMETHVGAFSINYGDATQITGSLTADGIGYGDIVKFGGTTGLNPGACVYLKSDGSWGVADATGGNAAAGMSGSLLGIAMGPNSDVDGVLLRGFVEANAVLNNIVGHKIYVLAHSAGRLTGNVPSSNGNIVRVVGYSLTSHDEIYFNPDNTYIEVTA